MKAPPFGGAFVVVRRKWETGWAFSSEGSDGAGQPSSALIRAAPSSITGAARAMTSSR